jgi:hypothetical protein
VKQPRIPLTTIVHPWDPDYRILPRAVEIRGFTLPRGTTCNGASVPGIVRPLFGDPFEGPNRDAGWLHDYLYATKRISRAQADELFYRELVDDGCSAASARIMYTAVRWFASGHYGSKDRIPHIVDEFQLSMWERSAKFDVQPLFGGP